MSDRNKAAVVEMFGAMDAAQDMGAAEPFLAPGYVVHIPGMPPMDSGGFKAFGNGFYAACPGLTHTVSDSVAEGDRVAARLTITGVHSAPFAMPAGTIPPTGAELVIEAMNMYRFADGKVAEQWVSFDMLGVLQTLGTIPA